MPENLENEVSKLVGVVYSKKENKVYCIEGSEYYNVNFKDTKDPDVGIIYMTSIDFDDFVKKALPIVSEWKVEDVLALEIKRETAQPNQISFP